MADFNGGSPPFPKQNQQKLPDHLILEIIARLSLKQATRCSLLDRNLRRFIAQPELWRRHAAASSRAATIFHFSATSPKVFTRFGDGIRPESKVNLERETSIIASCNGILLLRIKSTGGAYSIFNPITRRIRRVDIPVNDGSSVTLAAGPDDADSLFKVVAAEVAATEPDRTVMRISVFVPSSDRSFSLETGAELLSRRRFTLTVSRRRFTLTAAVYSVNVRPVYAAGAVYWLGDDAEVTVAFDLIKQRGSVTDGPVIGENRTGDKWFGYTGGSVRFVHSLQEEIVIYGHDCLNREWRVDHRIVNISNPSNNDYHMNKYGRCVHLDGGRLFFLLRRSEMNGHVYVYDLSTKKWEKSDWWVGSWTDSARHFFSFIPTTAKVSDMLIDDLKEENSESEERMLVKEFELKEMEAYKASLLGLHKLLKPTTKERKRF